jgi:mono/diheme cytochrome c family protein
MRTTLCTFLVNCGLVLGQRREGFQNIRVQGFGLRGPQDGRAKHPEGTRLSLSDRQVGDRRKHPIGPLAVAELKLGLGSAGASPSRKSRISLHVLSLSVALLVLLCFPMRAVAEDDADFFEKKVRPIFSERCESCHSTAKGKSSGGLALDTLDGWQKGGDSGSPVVPGKPDQSLLIQAVQYAEGGPQMPPKANGGKLSDTEIASLVEWVRRGAPDTRTAKRIGGMTPDEARLWWSFQPVRAVVSPVVKAVDWPQNDLDRFVLAKLEERKLPPAPPSDRRMLLRRATFDLTGLPPTPDEVQAYLSDPSPDAFSKVIERLLNSPAYGQRWARHWLDVARYADFYDANPKTRTASCEITEAWRYRDWVVDSFNGDLPFDQFIMHQIAGDLLRNPNGEDVYPAGLVATTFLTNGVWDRGDADKEKIVSDMADDNIDVIGKAFMGLTLGCARCHDHKFDPISTEDYYALAGIFYSSHILKELGAKGAEYTMNRLPLLSQAALAKRGEQEKQLALVTAKLDEIDSRQRYQELVAGGQALVPTEFKSAAGATGTIAPDGSILVNGTLAKDTYTVKAVAPEGIETRIVRLEVLSDPSLPAKGPGRAGDGNFVISRLSATFAPPGNADAPAEIKFVAAKADFEQSGFPIASTLNAPTEKGWAIHPAAGKDHVATFVIALDVKIPAGSVLTFKIDQQHSDSHALGKFRFSVTNALQTSSPQNVPERQELIATRDQLQKELAVPIPVAMAMQDGGMPGGLFPGIQDVPIHIRGSYARLGPVVPRRFPKFFAGDAQPPIKTGSGRRELAAWVASKENPLAARVIVNRVWQWHFGEGVVRTPSNFGKLGELPTHPELLDWLAASFIEDGWSLKKLHRRIMLSATYQQSSKVPHERIDQDPENRWLGRFSARRLEAESIRDALLFVSGQLDPVPGGPAGDDLTIARRTLYVQTARWDRGGYAMLFDAANPDASAEKRVVSTVAPQALLLLNNEYVQTQARHLAERLAKDVPHDDTARIQRAYQLLFGRPPSNEELDISRQVVGTPGTSAGWVDLAHVLLCTNEFVYLD